MMTEAGEMMMMIGISTTLKNQRTKALLKINRIKTITSSTPIAMKASITIHLT